MSQMVLIFLLIAGPAQARLTDASDISREQSELNDVAAAVDQFRRESPGASPEYRAKYLARLQAVVDKYPSMKSFSAKLHKVDPKGEVRIAMSDGDGQVKFIVFDRGTGKEIYSLNTTASMANYYKAGLQGRADACRYGCQIVPIGGQ